jgi:type IV pilus assembly protein PilB
MSVLIPLDQLRAKLVAENLTTAEQFDAVVTEANRKEQSVIDLLVSELQLDPDYLYTFVAQVLGVKRVSFDVHPIDEKLVKLLPESTARQRQSIVFTEEPDGSYGVAMADPGDLETIKFLRQYLGRAVTPYLATQPELNRGFLIYGVQTASGFKKIIEENVAATLRSGTKTVEEAAATLPIVAIVDNLLSYAAASNASDIHVEVIEDATLIRYRVDGLLYEIMRVPKEIHPALVARLKLLSGLKIDEHYKPQDGRFRYQIINQTIDCRVSVMPTYYGEKVVMRLLASAQKPLSLEELGMTEHNVALVAENLKKAYGMVMITGPTGSGKSTTLYALMNMLNKPNVNMVTVEDPIEYNMRYVNQTQINPQAGITFASGIRALLRQDPDIIMVGEIRDGETASISVQAALTGHLVLTTLHTNDAPTAIPRLIDLEVPPFLVSSVLNAIIAQRLVRKICTVCIYSYPIDDTVTATIKEQFAQSGLHDADGTIPKVLYKGKGCAACGFSGYRGREGIFEVLQITEAMKKLIAAPKFDLDAVRAAARKEGMRTMFEDGLEKVQRAETSMEEVLRVIRE